MPERLSAALKWLVGVVALLLLAASCATSSSSTNLNPTITSVVPGSPAGAVAPALPARPESWPRTLQLGVSDAPGGAAAARASAPFGFRYQYLAGGVNTGKGWPTWNPDGQFVSLYIAESQAAGIIPVFSYYQLLQSSPGAGQGEPGGDFTNLNNVATMTAYFRDMILFFQRAETKSPVVLHVEPDLWAYMQQQAQDDDAGTVSVQVASTGLAELVGLPNSAAGFGRAFVRLRDKYAPNVLLAYHFSIFATGTDILYARPTDAVVDALGTRAGRFYRSLAANFDVAFTDLADRDAGLKQVVDHDGGAAWYTADDYRRSARYISAFVRTAQTRVVIWQIPYGNTKMLAENNTDGHYQDNKVEWLLDDPTMAHLNAYLAAGVVALLFGAGGTGATCDCDADHDGVTNPPPINGNDAPSLNADDDGGYFHQQASAFYRAPPVQLP